MHKIMVVVALLIGVSGNASAQQDATTQPIDQKSLIQGIQSVPLNSPQQAKLMSRADASGLYQVAYEQYTRLWKRSPQDVYANLYRGEAAEDYWQYATRPDVHQLSLVAPQAQELFQVARDCLAEAQKRAPNSISANLAYGRYLFWYGSQMPKGLSYIKKAVALNPKNYAAHTTLGDAYAEHSGMVYNLPLAEKELKTAVTLNPTAAYPHWRLIRVYLDEGRQQNAKRELQAYVSLTPPSTTQTQVISFYQNVFHQNR